MIRCAIASWVGLILIMVPSTENTLGTAAFLVLEGTWNEVVNLYRLSGAAVSDPETSFTLLLLSSNGLQTVSIFMPPSDPVGKLVCVPAVLLDRSLMWLHSLAL